jgi:uncharacterized protein (DUF4415 family)
MPESKDDIQSEWIDPDDAPEIDDAWLDRADFYIGEKLIRRGRPPSAAPKVSTTVRFDPEVIAGFKEDGPGWQTRMNDVLKDWLKGRPAKA